MGKTRRAEAPGGGGAIASLYDKLEHTILPLYYSQPQTYSPKSLASESDLAGAVVKQAGELERSALADFT